MLKNEFKFEGLEEPLNQKGTNGDTLAQPSEGDKKPDSSTEKTSEQTNAAGETDDDNNKPSTDSSHITVNVRDKAPVILLFGAPSSGKTMTLVRLARYLRNKGYTVSVDKLFVIEPNKMWEYEENSKNFNTMLTTDKALKGTNRNDFLFIRICDERGTLICQILEGAGEDYFTSSPVADRAQSQFPPYMTGIFNESNKKVWIFLTEPEWHGDRAQYVERIRFCKRNFIGKKDKSIILYNKVDMDIEACHGQGIVNVKTARRNCSTAYDGLFKIFKNNSPWPWASTYTCKFVPFCTGTYGISALGELPHYDPSPDIYPAELWNEILNCIKG